MKKKQPTTYDFYVTKSKIIADAKSGYSVYEQALKNVREYNEGYIFKSVKHEKKFKTVEQDVRRCEKAILEASKKGLYTVKVENIKYPYAILTCLGYLYIEAFSSNFPNKSNLYYLIISWEQGTGKLGAFKRNIRIHRGS